MILDNSHCSHFVLGLAVIHKLYDKTSHVLTLLSNVDTGHTNRDTELVVLTRNWRFRDHLIKILRPVQWNGSAMLHERCEPSFVVQCYRRIVDYLLSLHLIGYSTLHSQTSQLSQKRHSPPRYSRSVFLEPTNNNRYDPLLLQASSQGPPVSAVVYAAACRWAQHRSSGAVVTVQRVRRRLQISRLTYLLNKAVKW